MKRLALAILAAFFAAQAVRADYFPQPVGKGTGPAIAQYPAGTTTTVVPVTVSGDGTIAQGGALSITKTNGVPFAPSATIDATNAANLSNGTLSAARMPLGITTIPLAGQLLIGNASGTAFANQTMSGDGTITNNGTLNVGNLSHVTNGTLASSGLAATGAAAGSYTNPNITVNPQGQITTVSNGLAVHAVHSQTVSANLSTYALQNAWTTVEVFTFSATAQVTLPSTGITPGQMLTGIVCQNATGGFVPTFVPAAGLTIKGTWPTFTTAANTCGDFAIIYTATNTAYLTGSAGGPL